MVNDVRKRQRDPKTYRRAATYVLMVNAAAALAFAVAAIWTANRSACADADTLLCDTGAKTAMLLIPTVILLLGGVGAFIQTYREWRRGRPWPIWQGAGWFLFMVMMVYLAIGGSTVAR
ncbi:hypothetical protein [Nocardia sp. NPDC052316]|uniref:hypothetical protein n=1 Tax=Nocardia sp. NPDC052316 TaxID=3364329 RepID=UPI0037CA2E20